MTADCPSHGQNATTTPHDGDHTAEDAECIRLVYSIAQTKFLHTFHMRPPDVQRHVGGLAAFADGRHRCCHGCIGDGILFDDVTTFLLVDPPHPNSHQALGPPRSLIAPKALHLSPRSFKTCPSTRRALTTPSSRTTCRTRGRRPWRRHVAKPWRCSYQYRRSPPILPILALRNHCQNLLAPFLILFC